MTDLRQGIQNVRTASTREPAESLTDQELFAVYIRTGWSKASTWGREMARRGITRTGLVLGPEGYAAYDRIEELGKSQRENALKPCPARCPRCGKNSMRMDLLENALSRHAGIYVCPACGTDEAIRTMPSHKTGMLPFQDWAVEKDRTAS